jgi:uncharacterized damage-inducible protein DinB
MPASDFLSAPGRGGTFGGLMDEYARAAAGFCQSLEAVSDDVYLAQREGQQEFTATPRRIALHCCRAAWGYAADLRRAQGESPAEKGDFGEQQASPGAVRAELRRALRETEQAVEALWDLDDPAIMKLSFTVSWGATYDPESMLEHAIVHLLRHRRQVERW